MLFIFVNRTADIYLCAIKAARYQLFGSQIWMTEYLYNNKLLFRKVLLIDLSYIKRRKKAKSYEFFQDSILSYLTKHYSLLNH